MAILDLQGLQAPETNAVATMILAFSIGTLLIAQLVLTWQSRRQGRKSGGDMAAMITEQR